MNAAARPAAPPAADATGIPGDWITRLLDRVSARPGRRRAPCLRAAELARGARPCAGVRGGRSRALAHAHTRTRRRPQRQLLNEPLSQAQVAVSQVG